MNATARVRGCVRFCAVLLQFNRQKIFFGAKRPNGKELRALLFVLVTIFLLTISF